MTVIYAINHILEAFFLYYYIFSIYPHIHTIPTDYVATFLSYLILFVIFLNKILNINIAFQFIIFFLLVLYLTHDRYIRCCFHSTLTLFIITVSELVYDIPTVLFNKNTAFMYPTIPVMIFAVLIQRCIHFCLVYTSVKIQKKLKNNNQPITYELISTISLFICTSAIIAIQNLGFTSILSKKQIPWVYVILFSIAFLSVGIIVTVNVIQNKQTELDNTREELQRIANDEGYNKLIAQIDTDQKIMIHDINNHLQAIQDSLNNNNLDDAKLHIDELISSDALATSAILTDNHTLSLLLARYKSNCQDENIYFSTDVKNAHLSYLTPSDITSLFCNLIDNAIEASRSADNPMITLRITSDLSRPMDLITITNTCIDHPTFEKNGFLSTHKKDARKHGFGMQSIKKVVERYNGVIVPKYIMEESVFQISICLYPEV